MAKSDQDRLGVFSEPGYISLGDTYKSKLDKPKPFNRGANKKKPIMTHTAVGERNATSDGYFTKGFDRIYAGEATYDPVRARRLLLQKEKLKNVAGPFKPTPATKKIVSSGSYDETLGGKIDAMSPKVAQPPKHVAEKRNFTTQPSKKGTGYGYAAVTLSALPEYKTSPYKNEVALAKKAAVVAKKKRMAGALKLNAPAIGGTFSKDKTIFGPPAKTPRSKKPRERKEPKKLGPAFYPSKPLPAMDGSNKNLATFTKFEYASAKARETEKRKPPKFGQFRPQGVPRSMVQKSVIQMNAGRSINHTTYRTVTRC